MDLVIAKRDTGKKADILRKQGILPAVVYGRKEESTPISIDRKQFEKVFKAAGESTVLTLKGLGEDKEALIHEVEVDAVTGEPIHADLYAIAKGQTVTVSIPLNFDGVSPAVKDKGGILVKVMHQLEIEVLPKDLPQSIPVDISKLVELEDQIKVKDLPLPSTAKLSVDLEEVVAMIDVAKDEPVEETPVDISSIEISEERGKKPEEGIEGAPEAPAKESKEKKDK